MVNFNLTNFELIPQAAGVDRGGDLEDNEGESVAFSEDVLFHTRPFSNRTIAEISSNFQSNITFDTFDSMFPPTHCRCF